jgi:hypothetical protein
MSAAGSDFQQMGTDPKEHYEVGIGSYRADAAETWFAKGTNAVAGYYNSFVGQLQARLHDWCMGNLSFLRDSQSLVARDLYFLVNMSTALVFQAAAEAAVTSALDQAFGKTKETPSAVINQLNGATSFFSIPKHLPPGVTREQIARSAIRVRW